MVAKQPSVLRELRSSVAKGQQAPSVEASQAFLCCGKTAGSNNRVCPFLCGFKTLIYLDLLLESNLFLSTPST